MNSPFRDVLILILLVSVPAVAAAQTGLNNIGPPRAAIAGGIAGGAAVIGLVLYFTLHKAPSITGCVLSANGEVSLTDEKDRRSYALIGESPDLKAGRRVKLCGKKIKDNDGKFTFRVKKIDHDYGTCSPLPGNDQAGGPRLRQGSQSRRCPHFSWFEAVKNLISQCRERARWVYTGLRF